MTSKRFFTEQDIKAPAAPALTSAADLNQPGKEGARSSNGTGRLLGFSYLNQGSSLKCSLEYWLEAKVQLIVERQLNRVRNFPAPHPHGKTIPPAPIVARIYL